MSSEREALLNEAKSLLMNMTEEKCEIAMSAFMISEKYPELSIEECVELAKKEVTQHG